MPVDVQVQLDVRPPRGEGVVDRAGPVGFAGRQHPGRRGEAADIPTARLNGGVAEPGVRPGHGVAKVAGGRERDAGADARSVEERDRHARQPREPGHDALALASEDFAVGNGFEVAENRRVEAGTEAGR